MTVRLGYDFVKTFRKGKERSDAAEAGAGTVIGGNGEKMKIGRRDFMANTTFMRVEEVAEELGVSKSYAYKIVQKLNAELKAQGFLTISGRINKQYFLERACYDAKKKERD